MIKFSSSKAIRTLLLCMILSDATFVAFSQKLNIPPGDLNGLYYKLTPLSGSETNVTYVINGTADNRDFTCANGAGGGRKKVNDEYKVILEYGTPEYTVNTTARCDETVAFYTQFNKDAAVASLPLQNQNPLYSKGFYIKADVGIGMGLTTEMLTRFTTTSSEAGTTTITENIKAHLGTGLPLELAGGYKFDHHYGVELAVDYYQGFSTKKVDMSNSDALTTKVSASMFSLTPSFKMQMECGPVLPFARIGPEIGFQNYFKTVMTGPTYMFKSTQASQSGEMDTRDYGGIALGIKAALGVEYPITKLISAFGEIQGRAISFSPKHGKITKYTVDGVDQLSAMSAKAKTWDFVKSKDSSVPIPGDQPNQFLQVSHSLSNVALVFGVIFNFGKPEN